MKCRTHAPHAGRNGRSTVTMRNGNVVVMKKAKKYRIVREIDASATIAGTHADPA
ncbi:hypothetical protein NTJ56_00500 [Burkholderia contaminans]|uniref:hypothetical protein n=1 Tax=Burkholderia contaminans TaxID=488447 RepID=UPI001CF1CCC3|nr:hypothetical protein [Burkholderia contaminans]MCA7919779.1 hypothetical protein [Burkholderia contaminans]MCA8101264.1 hypothetical protein [Burkholderia contaminans]UUX37341.1 hypothetical protein NTJ56_00500 [Burkholderia contaminans]